ncbi:MAG: ArsI/CadI family heavy metal resistance metalloenzyme [Cyclobacteriaceae bacterium]
MKTLHVNLQVKDLNQSVGFYNALFNAEPTVQKPDYAKWLIDDPRVNFSISVGGENPGLRHLGIQAETEEELKEVYANIDKTQAVVDEEGHTVCCYAQSEKSWVKDPQGVEWEAFHTYGESEVNFKKNNEEEECCDEHCCAS